jgi:hypothetical protein
MRMEHTHNEQMLALLGEDNLPSDATTITQSTCWVAPITLDNEGHPAVIVDGKHEGQDIYDVLALYGGSVGEVSDMVAMFTVGWACPAEDAEDIQPSKHPKRLRVALLCLATRDGFFGSAMRLGDDEEIIVDTEGNGRMKEYAQAALFA